MRLLPDTLFGRLISAVLGVVAVALLVIVALILRERRELLFAGSEAEAIATTIAETTAQLAALPADARPAEIERMLREGLTISRGAGPRGMPPGPGGPVSRADFTAALATLPARLARDLGEGYRIEVRNRPPGPPRGDAIRVRIERRGERPPPDGRFPPPDTAAGPPGRDAPSGDRGRGPLPGPRDDFGPGGPGGPGGRGGGPPRELEVAVTLPDGATVAFHTDMPRAGPPLPRRIFVELALLTLVLAAVLFVMARTIDAPADGARARRGGRRARRARRAAARDGRSRAARGDARVQRDAGAPASLSRQPHASSRCDVARSAHAADAAQAARRSLSTTTRCANASTPTSTRCSAW